MVTEAIKSDMVSRLIGEALVGESLGEKELTSEYLVECLINQIPDCIYFNDKGEVCRVLLFGGRYSNEALIRLSRFEGKQWVKFKGEHLIGRDPRALEDEIKRWRGWFGMSGDLLNKPDLIFKSRDLMGLYLTHVALQDSRPLVSCSYSLNSHPDLPRKINLSNGGSLGFTEGVLILDARF